MPTTISVNSHVATRRPPLREIGPHSTLAK